MKKIILYQILIPLLGSLLIPSFAYSNTCIDYFQTPTITEISQLSREQLLRLKDLARLEIETQSIANAIIRSNQFREVSEKLEVFVNQLKMDLRVYGQVRLEVWKNIKLKRQTNGEQLHLQEEAFLEEKQRVQELALHFEPEVLSRYKKKNLTEVLHVAFQHQDKDTHATTVEVILNNPFLLNKIDIRERDNSGYTLLHSAIRHAKESELEVLLISGINPNAQTRVNSEETVLHKAARFRDASILELLHRHGGNLNIRDNQGDTPLFDAQTTENVEFLLKNGAKVDARNEKGRTPLHHAAWFFQNDINRAQENLKLLLQYGADINAKDKEGKTALHGALENSHLAMIDFLKTQCADIEVRDNEGRTPLIYLVERVFGKTDAEKIQFMERLLKNGADINAKKDGGRTALHYAVDQTNLVISEALIKNGADVNARDENGVTILHEASSPTSINQSSVLKILDMVIQKGADKHAKTNKGNSILHLAYRGNYTLIEVLLNYGTDVNIKGPEGQTLLHLAVQRPSLNAVEMLIKNKADVNIRDDHGKTPLHYVNTSTSAGAEIKNLLLQNGAVE